MLIDSKSIKLSSKANFIVLEGVNGAGKSTLQRRLAESLRAAGKEVVSTFEPGDTPLGKTLRTLLLTPEAEKKSHLAELFLFAADRAEHVAKVINPSLEKGIWVISDRYTYSLAAFQGYGRGLDLNIIHKVNEIATAGRVPDLVILLDLPVEEGLRRTKGRGGEDAFEDELVQFHERIRSGFLEMARTAPEPFLLVDATKSADEVFNAVMQTLE